MIQLSYLLVTDTYLTVRPVIDRLRQQTIGSSLEIVLIAPTRAAIEPQLAHQSQFGAVLLLEHPIEDLGAARAYGIAAATAPTVFIGETHSYPQPDLAARLLDARARGFACAAPGMGNANPAPPAVGPAFSPTTAAGPLPFRPAKSRTFRSTTPPSIEPPSSPSATASPRPFLMAMNCNSASPPPATAPTLNPPPASTMSTSLPPDTGSTSAFSPASSSPTIAPAPGPSPAAPSTPSARPPFPSSLSAASSPAPAPSCATSQSPPAPVRLSLSASSSKASANSSVISAGRPRPPKPG